MNKHEDNLVELVVDRQEGTLNFFVNGIRN
jgi:hypothetical protein